MSLAEDLIHAEQDDNAARPCKTALWLQTLSSEDRAAFDAYVGAGKPIAILHRAAIRNGCPAAETRFRLHCRHRCSCYGAAAPSSLESAA
ncbi:hypothetical protein [Nocardia sp. CC227C]|uniref:hypothetical protein n=1 Tax=Nocardia sp. CC227C TaxID=3044562 RepID=UPI00278BC063|nr:hypothetical protein [Nocardia sp. CC227C]